MAAAAAGYSHPSLEEPRSIVQQLVTKFQASSDIEAIERINGAFEQIQEHRAQRLSASRDLLHQWMKKVEAAKWEAQRPADRTAARHAEEMSVLERERFSLAKAINDLESSLVQYESVLAIQKTTLGTLQAENAKHTRGEISKIDIEWNFYRELGLDWLLDDPESVDGRVKCRVKNAERNDIFTALLDEAREGPVEQANLLWGLCCN